MPEIWLILAMAAVILVPFIQRRSVFMPTITTIVGLALALLATVVSQTDAGRSVLHGALVIDPFSQFFKLLLIAATLLVVGQWLLYGQKRTAVYDTPDFLCLLLGATAGMSLMVSASNLLVMVIAIETASLPSYAMAGFAKRTRIGSESALKYAVFGAAASAVMIYGISLLYGLTGSLDLATVSTRLAETGLSPLAAVGLAAMLAGIAFKLSAVPMHFWCPDVFEGAPTEVTTFLSVASKGAAVCLLVRVLHNFGAGAAAARGELFMGLAIGVGLLGAVTATWGNLVALRQNNVKRLLAYSSIAHAGYMIMAVSLLAVAGLTGKAAQLGVLPRDISAAVLFYLLVYLFMNTGAFTVAAMVADRTGSEDIRDYAGLMGRSPAVAVLLTLFLLSLFGMPGLGGFLAKFYLMIVMAKLGPAGFVLIAVLLINTLISLYYYVRPVYYMAFVSDDQDRPAFTPALAGLALLLVCAAALLWTGLSGGTRLTRDYATLVTPGPDAMTETRVVEAR